MHAERPAEDADTDARAETVDILTIDSIKAAQHAAAVSGGPDPLVLVIPKYAPKGTEGWVYRIKAINKVTVSLDPIGGGRGLKADPFTLVWADADDVAAHEAQLKRTGPPPAEPVHSGTVVTVAGPRWKQRPGLLYVVTALKGMTEVSLARLGGDGGRTWPGIPLTYCTPVAVGRVALDTAPTDNGTSLTLIDGPGSPR